MDARCCERLQVHAQLYQHEVAVLDEVAARRLFRLSAGLEGAPPASLHRVEDAILKACGGLPLALLLLGGQLFRDTDESSWQVMQGVRVCCWVVCCGNIPIVTPA
jgi:hypothetical protein